MLLILMGNVFQDFTMCGLGVRWVGYTMTSYGLAGAVSALSINTLAGYIGRRTLIVAAIMADIAALAGMLTWSPDVDDHVMVYFLVPAISGIANGILGSQLNGEISDLRKYNIILYTKVYVI